MRHAALHIVAGLAFVGSAVAAELPSKPYLPLEVVRRHRTPVLLLIQDLRVRVVAAATGELLRDLILDPTRDYQPRGVTPGPQPKRPRTQ